MNMIVMLGILTVFYFITLTLICVYREKINTKICNLIFVIVDIVFFFCWTFAGYQKGWLNDGFLTLDNISPMVCTMIALIYLMNDKVRVACLSMVAFLAAGMFCAMYISPEQAYLFSFYEQANFIYASEASCHLVCSLFGFYLVLTDQIKPNLRYWKYGLIFTFSVVGFGVLLNFIFHKDFFGMNPYGHYSIYFVDIFGSFWATLFAYLVGILLVLTIGLQVTQVLYYATVKKESVPAAEQPEPVEEPTEQAEVTERTEEVEQAESTEQTVEELVKEGIHQK